MVRKVRRVGSGRGSDETVRLWVVVLWAKRPIEASCFIMVVRVEVLN